MHLNFKRIALLAGHVARSVTREVSLTPARMDLMIELLRGEQCQRQLADALCVSETVVSRMVRALERLELVRRRTPRDRRFRLVQLTERGRKRLWPMVQDDEILIEPDGTTSAQCFAESWWLADWEQVLESLGLGSLVRAFWPPRPEAQARHLDCMRRRRHAYRRRFMDLITLPPIDANPPYDVRPPERPLQRLPDPWRQPLRDCARKSAADWRMHEVEDILALLDEPAAT